MIDSTGDSRTITAVSPSAEFLTKCWKNINFMIGVVILFSIVATAAFAPRIAPFGFDEPHKQDRLAPPSATYLFGTDDFGRDQFSRVVYGARITLQVAVVGTLIQVLLGVTIGLICGYYGGPLDRALMYLTDVTWCIPGTVLALAVVTVLGKSLMNSIIAISLVNWAGYARVVRAKTMSLKNMPFIETAVAFGEKRPMIMLRYILPNMVPALIVLISMNLPGTILSTATLSFLGLGSQPPSPDWGLAISQGMKYVN
ncbi:MAG: ABC transporter permease, partial [Oscillospiraceae bacterium]|nr:ABC transporter permease [Oscillospiraceae bacterium]